MLSRRVTAALVRRPALLHRVSPMSSSPSAPIASAIERKLSEQLRPVHLEVHNDSHQHNVPSGSETHFTVVVVSDEFDGVPLLERHRRVNAVLAAELAGGVHALAIKAKTPKQWTAAGNTIDASAPSCRGGFGK
eukprot:TRINITY_DN1544_c0_g1_i4.p1 TRINITY_DN1544_c0_g1~~TRINITY_DN1544_c0_g1_i4.p1  ORF type:complete len:134 (-),score=32.56 TRINITY_DN1544_c0_g1_i4:33-434(-)